MYQKGAAVTMLTASHRFQGEIRTGGQRLQEVLNNSLSDFVHVDATQIFTLIDQETELRATSMTTVQKSQLQLVLIDEQKHEAPTKRNNYHVQKNFYEVFCVVGNYEVQGYIHLPRYTRDTIAILVRDIKLFFPLTEATIIYDVGKRSTLNAGVVLVNKSALSLFQIMD
ncbi:MAG: hypothetical protein R3C14_18815 [Caldilineaceae bacterium]